MKKMELGRCVSCKRVTRVHLDLCHDCTEAGRAEEMYDEYRDWLLEQELEQ